MSPGVDFRFVAGPGTPGFDPIAPLVPFATPSSLQQPDWQGGPGWGDTLGSLTAPYIRQAIDRLMGGVFGAQEGAPVEGGLMRPEPGTPGGEIILSAGQAICAPRPKVGFIRMPNGMLGCPSGYHPEKGGKPYCVRNRRMNPLNPRALSRATRRVGGFARAVKRARTLKKVCKSL